MTLPGYARPNRVDVTGFDIQVGAPNGLSWRPMGRYIDAEFEWHWYLPSFFTITLKPDHPMVGYFSECRRRVIHIRTWRHGKLWSGRIMKFRAFGVPGRETVIITGVSNLFWSLRGLAWVNNLTPPFFQLALTGKQDVRIGSFDRVSKSYLSSIMTRLRKPVYSGLPLRTPSPGLPNLKDIATLDDALDIIANAATESEFVILQARFPSFSDLIKQSVENLEVGLSMDLWTPADGQPSPSVFNTDTLAQLQSVIDYSSDNFLNFGNPGNILGLANPSNWNKMTRTGYVFNTHKKRDMRQLMWRTDGNQIAWIDRTAEHADATRTAIGGKAPEFLNQAIEWGANFAIQLLLNLLIPGANLGTILVGDLFDDIFFAYQTFWDPDLEDELGEHGFGEVFGDNTAAWSLDGASTGLSTLKKHSGSDAVVITPNAGVADRGYQFGRDYECGDIMTFWDRGITKEQYVSQVKIKDSGDGRMVETVVLGDAEKVQDGFERVIGLIHSAIGTFNGIANSL
ncbi:hypothetical protein CH304_00200 [Rhodococcus sp. 15-649-1-2]|nr:hypothetical protein [Rhodococcus sp. 15-649-1-2]OZE88026.1 hypothetical protein CH304_00200 [Rhodococcus sp. 15-649-1-2]